MNPKAHRARRAASISIALVGLIHLVLAGEYLHEQAYVGALFIAGGIASAYVAARLWKAPDVVAWAVGSVVAAGMFAGFVLSRTVGLPGFHESEWEGSGVASLLLEAGYLAALGSWLRNRSRRWQHVSRPRALAGRIERLAPAPRTESS
jgi:hypothetical protein